MDGEDQIDPTLMQRVMEKIEAYYLSDDENSGEAVFNWFAEEYHELFEGDFEVDGLE